MKVITRFIIFLLLISILNACKQAPSSSAILELSDTEQIILLDSMAAAKAIMTDKQEHFFQHITSLDMMIQMQQSYEEGTARTTILEDYRQFLEKDVSNFTSQEVAYIEEIFQEAFQQTKALSTAIFPDKIFLIKTNGQHYGNSVYYTRDHCIIIPANVLKERNRVAFLETMLHEVFHIYSRYHPEKRKVLYQFIGFEDVGGITNLQLPPALAQRYLLNPDGVDFAEAITLQMADSVVQAVPIIISNETKLVPEKSEFFPYLEFQLFPVQKLPSGKYEVIAQADGTSPLQLNTLSDFFRQIRDNTTYIIHPDEILADNFVLLVKNEEIEQLSTEGQQLLEKIKLVLVE